MTPENYLVNFVSINDFIGLAVGIASGWIISWYYYMRSRVDSQEFIDILRTENNALKDKMGSIRLTYHVA